MAPSKATNCLRLLVTRFSLLSLLTAFFVTFPPRIEAYILKPLEDLLPTQHAMHPKVFTEERLKQFDGSVEKREIFVAVRGIVFDVSKDKRKYGKGGALNVFAGREASRAIAKMSTKPEDLTDVLTGLTDQELERLDNVFAEDYRKRFPVEGFTEKLLGDNANLFVYHKEEL